MEVTVEKQGEKIGPTGTSGPTSKDDCWLVCNNL